MAKNYDYGILFGMSVDDEAVQSELKRIQNYVNKSKATTLEIKTMFNNEALKKELVDVRSLLDSVSGEKIGEIGTFKVGDKFVEVQKTLKGTISGVEQLQQTMQRLDDGIEPLSNFEKKLESIKEKFNQLQASGAAKIINQNDLEALQTAINRIDEIGGELKNLSTIGGQLFSEKNGIQKELDGLESAKNIYSTINSYQEELAKRKQAVEVVNQDILETERAIKDLMEQQASGNLVLEDEIEINDQLEEQQAHYKQITSEAIALQRQVDLLSDKMETTTNQAKSLSKGMSSDEVNSTYAKLSTRLKEVSAESEVVQKKMNALNSEQSGLFNGLDVGFTKVANATKNYNADVNELSKTLKSQLTEAGKVATALNKAYASNNTTGVAALEKQLDELNKKIKATKSSLTSLTGDKTIQQSITKESGKTYSSAKAEQEYAKQQGAVKLLDEQLKQLYATEEKLNSLTEKSKSAHSDLTQALTQQKQAIENEIASMTKNNTALTEYVNQQKKAQDALNQTKAVNAQYSQALKEQQATMSNFNKELKEYVTYSAKASAQEQKMASDKSKATKAERELLSAYKERAEAAKANIDLMQKEASSSSQAAEMSNKFAEAERNLALRQKEQAASSKEGASAVDTLKESLAAGIDHVIKFEIGMKALNAAINAIGNSIHVIQDLNKAMVDVQLVTGQTDAQMAKTANEYANLAKELGSTTEMIASSASEWLQVEVILNPFN